MGTCTVYTFENHFYTSDDTHVLVHIVSHCYIAHPVRLLLVLTINIAFWTC
jgi:hypothetical protein